VTHDEQNDDYTDTAEVKLPRNAADVTHLNLFYNDIKGCNGLGPDRWPNLMRLTLASNDIKSIKGVAAAPHLRYLDVSDNDVKELDDLSGMPGLQWLNLHHNDLRGSTFGGIEGLGRCQFLTWLCLSSNDLTTLRGVEHLSNLMFLDASYNDLEEIYGIEYCTAIVEVNVYCNNLRSNTVPQFQRLACLPKLRTLNIGDNYLEPAQGGTTIQASLGWVNVINDDQNDTLEVGKKVCAGKKSQSSQKSSAQHPTDSSSGSTTAQKSPDSGCTCVIN
jgi:hypothetical protein